MTMASASSDQRALEVGAPVTWSPPTLSSRAASESLLAPESKRQQAALWRWVLDNDHALVHRKMLSLGVLHAGGSAHQRMVLPTCYPP